MEKQNETAESSLKTYILENTPARIRERYAHLKEYAQTHTFGALDADVVVLDTETTGFSFNHDELIQIAAARMCNGEIVEWYVTFVNPGKEIPDEVAHLTNIHEEDVADAPIQTPHSLGLSISWGTRSLLRTTLDSTAHSLRNGQQGPR